MDVRMPDGTVIQNVPDGISQRELLRLYQSKSAPVDLDAQLAGLFGETAPAPERPDPSLADYAKAGLSVGSAAATALPATLWGTVEGIGQSIGEGTFGTPEGAQSAFANVQQRQQQATYSPDSPAAQYLLSQLGAAIEPVARYAEPLAPMAPMMGGGLPKAMRRLAAEGQAPMGQAPPMGGPRHAGAAQSATDLQRATMATELPIPMMGDRAPTLGQLTRDQRQLRLERELAKNDELGGPLRSRYDAQAEGLNANLDYLEQQFDARRFEDRGIGQAVTQSIEGRKASEYQKVRDAYSKAREAGELEKPVTLGNLDKVKLETQQLESLAPNALPIYREAQRLDILDGEGNPQSVPVERLETLRQFVNKATDPADRQQGRFRQLWTQAIDQTIDGADVGPLYRDARHRYSRWVSEFEETPLVRDVISTKRGTSERAIPYENVFQRTLLNGSVDEVNKLRGSLLRSEQGKEAWTDLKARFARHIAEQSRTSNTTANDQPIISPYKLGKTIDELSRTGKLDSIFGKRGAEDIRHIRELAHSMLTTPPHTVNASGTSAEVFNMLMRVARPLPFVGRLEQAVERSGIRKDIDRSLNLRGRDDLHQILNSLPSGPMDYQRVMADMLRRGK